MLEPQYAVLPGASYCCPWKECMNQIPNEETFDTSVFDVDASIANGDIRANTMVELVQETITCRRLRYHLRRQLQQCADQDCLTRNLCLFQHERDHLGQCHVDQLYHHLQLRRQLQPDVHQCCIAEPLAPATRCALRCDNSATRPLIVSRAERATNEHRCDSAEDVAVRQRRRHPVQCVRFDGHIETEQTVFHLILNAYEEQTLLCSDTSVRCGNASCVMNYKTDLSPIQPLFDGDDVCSCVELTTFKRSN